jgi:hypothetical protein
MECDFLSFAISSIFFASILMALVRRFDIDGCNRIKKIKDKWYEFIVYIFISMLKIISVVVIMTTIIFLMGMFGKFISWILCNLHWCKCG